MGFMINVYVTQAIIIQYSRFPFYKYISGGLFMPRMCISQERCFRVYKNNIRRPWKYIYIFFFINILFYNNIIRFFFTFSRLLADYLSALCASMQNVLLLFSKKIELDIHSYWKHGRESKDHNLFVWTYFYLT